MRLIVAGKPITDFERIKNHILASKDVTAFKPRLGTTGPVAICAAGPSLLKSLPILQEYKAKGIPICAIKGVAQVLLENGIVPDYAVFADHRENQARFVAETHPDILYLLATQTHPGVFDKLKADGCRVETFQCSHTHVYNDRAFDYLGPELDYITGGSTTGMRAINLMLWAGHKPINCFGYDCCLDGGVSHVYEKNVSNRPVLSVNINGRPFQTTSELAEQHQHFLNEYIFGSSDRNIVVFGNGALAESVRLINDGFGFAAYMNVMTLPDGATLLPDSASVKKFIEDHVEIIEVDVTGAGRSKDAAA